MTVMVCLALTNWVSFNTTFLCSLIFMLWKGLCIQAFVYKEQ